jgi:hypothetical protein
VWSGSLKSNRKFDVNSASIKKTFKYKAKRLSFQMEIIKLERIDDFHNHICGREVQNTELGSDATGILVSTGARCLTCARQFSSLARREFAAAIEFPSKINEQGEAY